MTTIKHSFAKLWLDKQGYEITINDTNYFKRKIKRIRKNFSIQPLRTYLRVGQELIDEEDLDRIENVSYVELKKKMGYTVYKLPLDKRRRAWYKGQKDVLILAKKRSGLAGEIPEGTYNRRGLKIEWNPHKEIIRGVGENFGTIDGQYGNGDITPWVGYSEQRRPPPVMNRLAVYSSYHDITKAIQKKFEGKETQQSRIIRIKELPVMITSDGHLICFPKSKNIPKILFVGKTRGGKSFGLSSIMSRVLYIYQDRVALLNDSLNQFYDLSLPQDKMGLKHELDRIGNEPRHLPVVNLYMSCPFLNMKYVDEDVSYRLVISLRDFINRWDFYAHGVKKWDIGAPFKYVDNKVMKLLCEQTTKEDIRRVLYTHFSELQADGKELDKNKKGMIEKWAAALGKVLSDEFTDNLFHDEDKTCPVWKLKRYDGTEFKGHPAIVCLEAGIVPVINNYIAKEYPIAKKQMADLIKKIVRHQMQSDPKKRVWVFIDELKDFLDKKSARYDDLYDALDYLFTQGAFNNLGFGGSVQEYSKLTNSMRNNASHLFIFEMGSSDERNAIAKDFELPKDKLTQIKELPKNHCILTTKEKVVIYDRNLTRKVVEGGMWQGKIVPTLTIHKSAGE